MEIWETLEGGGRSRREKGEGKSNSGIKINLKRIIWDFKINGFERKGRTSLHQPVQSGSAANEKIV